ncbi:MAG: NADH-quinone oxidoreductase subunit NuoG [Acidimicrobiia bacterium]|nr:NADH-quinone oxidoreductase subunit NuoG [Acidimicrobiia bacterium]
MAEDTTVDAAPDVVDDGVAVTIDGTEVRARKGELLIDAAERHGVYIPRFCYHERMRPVGMCRMCIVEVDTGRGPSLQPSCMLECTPDMVVDTTSEVTRKAQEGVLEFLLVNHPLDCPVCDKGGECPLQDQTMSNGPGESRYIEQKRHLEKPIPISDLVLLDRERCILCDRCTRFASEVAGDPLIHFLHRGNHTEVNTFPDEPFASYFSGNTVQICPVGALTATSYRFKARPWDLTQTESTCQSCSVGCRVAVQASRNEVLRILGVDVDPVNWGWLCDKGRFDFEAINSDERLAAPLVRQGDELAPAGWAQALRQAADALSGALDSGGPVSIGVLGGARLTNEDAYAWTRFAKGVLGTDNCDAQLGDGLPPEVVLGLPRATIDEVCRPGGTVVVVGPDPKEELPVLFLRLRHAVVEAGATLIEVAPARSGISDYATVTLTHRPGEVAEVVRALVGETGQSSDLGGADASAVGRARALLDQADGDVCVVLGRPSVAESADFVTDAASVLQRALPGARFLSALRRSNVHGALDMGLAPGLLPGRVRLEDSGAEFAEAWGAVPATVGLDAHGMLTAAAEGRLSVLVLLGADPLADFPDRHLAERALATVPTIVASDLFLTESSARAHVVLPAAGFAECEGTTTNLEGRVSVLGQKVTPPGTARSDWMIAAELARLMGHDLGLESPAAIWDEICTLAPSHRGVTTDLLRSTDSDAGVLVPLEREEPAPADVDSTDGVAAEDVAEAAVDQAAADDTLEAQAAEAEGVAAAAEQVAAEEAGELAEEAAADGPVEDGAEEAVASRGPATLRFDGIPAVTLAPRDAYSLRLVATRKLYDQGTGVQQSAQLAPLAPGSVLRLNRYDFERLGVEEGSVVRVASARGALRVPVVVDAGVPRGAAAVYVNQPGLAATSLVDAAAAVTEVRVETGIDS